MNSNNRKLHFTRRDGSSDSVVVGSVLLPPPFPETPPEMLHYPEDHRQTIDSSMALTILLLLTAIFFVGLFSLYIRRFSGDAAAAGSAAAEVGNYHRRRGVGQKKGLDPEVVRSLPAYCYRKGGEGKYDLAECAICLGEFEEEAAVKMIPVCQHVFHAQCVDAWLNAHVNCPLCRGTQFLGVVVEGGNGGGGGGGSGGSTRVVEEVEGRRSTVGSEDAWTVEMGLAGGRLRRICSSSSLVRKGQERISLPRTSSL
ncbi:unnamed protein product [Linum tenue]|uniref:RING-type E3 ubiquitin transferase n=1 Tax=Linum tenue TaxID=586396 RepID=A0AAV0IKL0_9ROSI|nr:unnamed protein product [Linum tenue]